jgi:hypothetical protein
MTISLYRKNHSLSINIENELSGYDSTYNFSTGYANSTVNSLTDYNSILPLTSFLQSFSKANTYLKSSSGILSPGLLYASDNHVIFERPPSYQTIFLIPELVDNINYNSSEPIVFRLPIPWQLYFVSYSPEYYTSTVHMYFMENSFVSPDQNIYLPPLTNFYLNGQLCRPFFNQMSDIDKYSKDIAGVMQSAYDWIWQSGTNLDLTMNIVRYCQEFTNSPDNTLLNLDLYKSDKNVNHYFNFNFASYYCTSSTLCQLFAAWEKVPLEEISSIRWPSPSMYQAFSNEMNAAREEHMTDYVSQNNLSSYLPDCCEDCVSYNEYYDEHSNTEDCECECHQYFSEDNIDFLHFLRWCKILPYQQRTFTECYQNFLEKNDLLSLNNSSPNAENTLLSIESQIINSYLD